MSGFMVAGRRVGSQAKIRHKNKRYVAGANLERQIKAYFELQGFDAVRSAGSHGEFDVWADNGLVLWKVQSKKGMSDAESNALADKIATSQQQKFKNINHPIAILVVQGVKNKMPFGVTRLLVPAETTAELVKVNDKKRKTSAKDTRPESSADGNSNRSGQ